MPNRWVEVAGNSQRPGAIRKTPRKGPTIGSGGQRRKGLQGRGPTPKAENRVGHKAAKAGARQARAAATPPSAEVQRRPGADLVTGRNAVVEVMRADVPLTTVYLASRLDPDERLRLVVRMANERRVPLIETSRAELDRLTGGAVHQGVAAQLPAYQYLDPADLLSREQTRVPLLLAVDGVTDPRNLGALVRSVAAFGGHGVIVPTRRSVGVTPGTWKASAGTLARVPVARAVNLTRTLHDAGRQGFFVVGLDADGDLPIAASNLIREPLILVVGSEGKGLSRLVRTSCDEVCRIPMDSSVESLNASVAVGVALYEVSRARAEQPEVT